jgi:transposase
MVKFSSEFREKVVLEYLKGRESSNSLSKKYGIASHQTVLDWVNRYKKYGGSSFNIRSSKYDYDGNFKLEVLEWKKRNGASLPETALHFDISTPSTIWSWEKKLEEEGIEALFKRRGRAEHMTTTSDHRQETKNELSEIDKLQRENRLLKIENEYLKKLRALMQEPDDTDKSKRK